MHLKKRQPPVLVSYRETSSSVCSFIDSGGPLKPLGAMPLLWACVWDLPTKGLQILFQELMISLWCLSAVLQALWCCSSKSHHCPFFSSAPRHPKYISFPISTPSQAKHKPVSCAATQKAGTPDTHSSPPSQEWSLQGHLVLTAEPHQSLQALWGQTMSVPLTLRVRGEEPVTRTPLRKLELRVNLPLSSSPTARDGETAGAKLC